MGKKDRGRGMIHGLHELVWGPALLTLLLAAGGYYTIWSGFFQIRGLTVWWRTTAGSLTAKRRENPQAASDIDGGARRTGRAETAAERGGGSLGRLQSSCMALAATIGTGNIVGVATALAAGGPGAVFWMWVSALAGMMTAYAEVSLGIVFRKRLPGGRWFGGPCASLLYGLGRPGLALLYGVLCLGASLGMGSMVQSNAIAQTLQYAAGIPPIVSAAVVTALTAAIVAGGAKRIAWVNARLIPVAAAVYTIFAAAVLILCRRQIPQVLAEIVSGAFLPRAAVGGIGGYGICRAFRYGMARGVFSNEAGLGTLAGLHSAADKTTPREQGMWAMFEVFFDTIFICTLTALVILCAVGGCAGLASSPYDGAALTGWCFGHVLGPAGEYLVSCAMIVFAFSTMIAWYFLGGQTLEAVTVLMGRIFAGRKQTAVRIKAQRGYFLLYAYAVFLGCVSGLTSVWEFSDVLNGLMALPNLLALFLLRRNVPRPDAARCRKYRRGTPRAGCSTGNPAD